MQTDPKGVEVAVDGDKTRDLARDIAAGCNYRFREHASSQSRWSAIATALTAVAAVSASIAGASILSSASTGGFWWYFAGILGVVGGAAGAVNLALDPKAVSEGHRAAAAAFSGFRTAYTTLAKSPTDDPDYLYAELLRLNAEKAEIEKTAPTPEAWTSRRTERERAVARATGDAGR